MIEAMSRSALESSPTRREDAKRTSCFLPTEFLLWSSDIFRDSCMQCSADYKISSMIANVLKFVLKPPLPLTFWGEQNPPLRYNFSWAGGGKSILEFYSRILLSARKEVTEKIYNTSSFEIVVQHVRWFESKISRNTNLSKTKQETMKNWKGLS